MLRDKIDEFFNIKDRIDLDARNNIPPIVEKLDNLSVEEIAVKYNIPLDNIISVNVNAPVNSKKNVDGSDWDENFEIFETTFVVWVIMFLKNHDLYAWYKTSSSKETWCFCFNLVNKEDALIILRFSNHGQHDWEIVICDNKFKNFLSAFKYLRKVLIEGRT
jgi:hypothetical protein